MAVRQGFGKVVTDGLVFAYDTGDTVNSYKGEPTTNLVGNSTFVGTNGTQTHGVSPTNWVFSGFTGANGFKFYDKDTSPIPLKFPNEQAVITTGPNSTSNRRIYFRRTDLQPSTTYSISCWMYFSRRWSNSWSKFQYDSGGAGISLASSYFGSFEDYATARGIGLDEWFKWEGTLTTESNTAQCYWGPVISRTHDVLVGMQRMQVEVKDHVTPFVKGSRSVSGSLLDLAGNETLDLSGTVFDASGSVYFDRSTSQITAGDVDPLGGQSEATWEMVVKPETYSGSPSTWRSGITTWNDPDSGVGHTWVLDLRYRTYYFVVRTTETSSYPNNAMQGGVSDVHFPDNEYTHYVATYDGAKQKIYINGELIATTNKTGAIANKNSNERLKIGVDRTNTAPMGGEIPIAKLYTRALTKGEVKQNFAMYKKRFNI